MAINLVASVLIAIVGSLSVGVVAIGLWAYIFLFSWMLGYAFVMQMRFRAFGRHITILPAMVGAIIFIIGPVYASLYYAGMGYAGYVPPPCKGREIDVRRNVPKILAKDHALPGSIWPLPNHCSQSLLVLLKSD